MSNFEPIYDKITPSKAKRMLTDKLDILSMILPTTSSITAVEELQFEVTFLQSFIGNKNDVKNKKNRF